MDPQNQQNPVNQPAQPPVSTQPVQAPVSVNPQPTQPAPTQPAPTVAQPYPVQVTPNPAPLQPQAPPQQSNGFAPSGFQQANFIQQGFQPGDIKPHKKGLMNSKFFIIAIALVMFTLVIGGWFAYTRLWVVDRAPALISFSNANRTLYKAIGGVAERQYPNLSALNEDYSPSIDKTRNDNLLTVFEKLDELIAKNQDEASKFNSLRDPEFAKLISDYSIDLKRCSAYVKDLNSDINSFGPPLEALRKAIEPIETGSSFSESSVSSKKKLLTAAKKDYDSIAKTMDALDLKTEQVKKIRDGYVNKLEDGKIDDLIKKLNDPAEADFVSTFNVTDFYDANKEGMNEINHELDKGTCHSDAREELNEIFADYDFKKEDKDLMESVELF